MHRSATSRLVAVLSCCGLLLSLLPGQLAQPVLGATSPGVLTRSYDSSRSGANLNEDLLTTANVNSSTFGKLFSRTVDGQIYAQPLYVPNLTIPGQGLHNVVFVATQHNSLYAFDADDPAASDPLWQVNLGPSAPTPNSDFGNRYGAYHDIYPEVGITSTPVIDLSTNTIYVVAFVKKNGGYLHRLHALDLLSGQDKPGSPVTIHASVPGTGTDGNIDGDPNRVTFDSKQHLQRSGLLLANNVLYIGFAGYADTDPYHGWLMAYDATSLQQLAVFNDTPNGGPPEVNGGEGGIWMSGQAPALDDQGNIYIVTGNGTYSANAGGNDYGNTVLKFSLDRSKATPAFAVQSWFTPYNYQALNQADNDLGVGGVVLLPVSGPTGQPLALTGSKEGKFYLLDRNNMGGFCSTCTSTTGDTNAIQSFLANPAGGSKHIHGSPVFWNGPQNPYVYVWGENDRLRQFRFDTTTGLFNTTAVYTSTMTVPSGMPGGILAVSANGNQAGSGIVWALHPYVGDANPTTRPGILRAFDASNVSVELWNSEQNSARDSLGYLAKFNNPMIANGKVYIGTFSNQLVVYGLLRSVVTKPQDDGAFGSLSYALANVRPNEVIQFRLSSGNQVSAGNTLTVPNGVRISGSCGPTGPALAIVPSNAPPGTDGLVLSGNNNLYGLLVNGFPARQIVSSATGTHNTLKCVRAIK